MSVVLVFGTFDVFHNGHDYFLTRARELGDRLVVGVARDAHVRALKGHTPIQDQETRLERVRRHPCVSDAVLCDEMLGQYEIVLRVRPDLIALGFDQGQLEVNLRSWMKGQGMDIPVVVIASYD
jgi:FAD synthetase